MSKLIEIGTLLGRDHASDHDRFRTHWETHVQKSREMILRGAGRVAEPHSVTILGGAASYNIPLAELADRFGRVRLIDIDADGLDHTVAGLQSGLRSKIEVEVADTTGGVATHLLSHGLDVIDNATTPEEASGRLAALFKGDGPDIPVDAEQRERWKASYVISSGLSSQLTIFPERGVAKAFQEKFDAELAADFLLKNGSFQLRNLWVRRHGEFLESLVLPDGRVYWADTVAETPYLSEFGPEPLSLIIGAVVSFLDRAYLKTFVNENGKQILAERFSEGLPGRPMDADDLIQAFAGRLHPEHKRRFAWAVMTLVGENCINSRREVELVTYIIREAERLFPNARLPLIEEGTLSGFFPRSLAPDGEMASWLWINDPEGTVTLDGYSYYVDAYVLKRVKETNT